ncbi:MAG: tetratricopeptide repeat protein [Chlamydiales bacterium]|nr:tetratricopeptide repeat protein [Chlamydiales bacterium]
MKWLLIFLSCLGISFGNLSEAHLETLYRSLDPESISELFAFYHLYPKTAQGEAALSSAWELMHKHRSERRLLKGEMVLPAMEIDSIISLVNKEPFETDIALSEDQLQIIETVSDHLANRKLKGHHVWKKEALTLLPAEEVDLSHALLLYQFEEDSLKVRQYEAMLDLIALQILARLPLEATAREKIDAISHFIFHEKRFRFPPHSLYAKDIDTYTFLSNVLDSHLGVCLGVSILYLSIAERLDVPLEIITPPGHIFIRYREEGETLNIETTARGIHIPDRMYLGINTRKLQERNKKEVIGLAFINQASVAWQKEDHETTVKLYEQALPFLPGDPLLKMFLGYNYLFIGKEKEGRKLLKEIKNLTFDFAVGKETTPEDFLSGKVNAEGIKTIFLHVDETRSSILEKQEKLKKILKKYPKFRDGQLQLAVTYLQLGRGGEALEVLQTYHTLDPTSPVVEYYLSIVAMNRFLFKDAWTYLQNAETLSRKRSHTPQCLKGLRHALRTVHPDPQDEISL